VGLDTPLRGCSTSMVVGPPPACSARIHADRAARVFMLIE